MIKCNICGKEYTSIQPLSKHITTYHNISKIQYYDTYIKRLNEGICLTCGKPTHFYGMARGYNKYCSKSCQVKAQGNGAKIDHNKMWDIRRSKIAKYEQEHNCTHISKLTDKYDLSNTPIIRVSKMYQYIDNNDLSKLKSKQTKKSTKSGYYLNRQFEIEHNCTQVGKLIEKYGQGWLSLKLPRIDRNHNVHFISNDYLPMIIAYASKNHSYRSNKEIDLYNYVCSIYNGKILHNARKIIDHYELDIWIPALSLAIEFNGTKWHSSENGMDSDYHLNKSLACRSKGIRLIYIYEFENITQQKQLLKDFILGKDNYPKNDFNKNNFLEIPKPEIVFKNDKYTVYGAGKLLGGNL